MCIQDPLSYFTDLQGSQTTLQDVKLGLKLSYFTDLQGSQTLLYMNCAHLCLVTLLIYKVLKPSY